MAGVKKKVAARGIAKNSRSKPATKAKKRRDKSLSNLIPRTRLEPRLIPSVPGHIQDNLTDIEKYRRLVVLVDKNEVNRYFKSYSHQRAPCKIPRPLKTAGAAVIDNVKKRKKNHPLSFSDTENGDEDVSQEEVQPAENKKKLRCRGKWWWTDIELKNLALGLQSHGFSDLSKIADVVKTKNETDIALYLKPRKWEFNKEDIYDSELPRGSQYNRWSTVHPEHLKTWPNVRKWRRIAYEQVIPHVRKTDYSEPLIASLCQKFYEEEEEPADPQIINCKLIYKYVMDCMAGKIPPQLPPKESALVLDILREIRSLPIMYDFEEEKQFLRDFKFATRFKPFEVKDEFKKKLKRDVKEEMCPPNTIPVPEEVFLDLSRHKKLVQSFNPLVTPVWMLQKEQEHVKNESEESNVYFD